MTNEASAKGLLHTFDHAVTAHGPNIFIVRDQKDVAPVRGYVLHH